MQYGNNGITSKKKGYAEIITADFYRRNAETVINSRKSIPHSLKYYVINVTALTVKISPVFSFIIM